MNPSARPPRSPSRLTAVLPDALRTPIGAARDRLCRLVFDRGNVDTSGVIGLEHLGVGAPGRSDYAPSGWLVVRRFLRGQRVGGGDVFVDFGCGMGRVLCQVARHHGFGRVVGVEIAPQLAARATANVEANRHRLRCRDVEVAVGDALEFPIPVDMTFAYFANPFEGPIFARVVERIIESLDRAPRRLILGYLNPLMDRHLRETGRFRLVRLSRGMRPDIRNLTLAVYESTP
jgi:SAM-dependent methyltransferase